MLRLQLPIFDRENILFPSSAYFILCAIRQPQLTEIFQAYFEAVWNAAIPLKEGDYVYKDEVRKILKDAGS